MLTLRKTKDKTHEDVIIERYDWLFRWSLKLTEHKREEAEDLAQEVFVHFTLSRPDLETIQNLDGYLYGMLRNLHLARVRKDSRVKKGGISSLDYDSAELLLRVVDPGDRIQALDELRRICEFACARKETSKTGSVLILRFFHGYYPDEIARILLAPRRATDDYLLMARRELKRQIQASTPGPSLKYTVRGYLAHVSPDEPDAFLAELRRIVFRSRHGDCASTAELREIYQAPDPRPVACAPLAHIVSCAGCLQTVNALLGLPPLSDRFPPDMLRVEADSGRGGAKLGGGPRDSGAISRCKKRARLIYEHDPNELFISVNGFPAGSQTLGPGLSRQTLNINPDERIGFIEAHSEQGVRLLYLNVEQPPDGPVEQSIRTELSDGRTLDLAVDFRQSCPFIKTAYANRPAAPFEVTERASAGEIDHQEVLREVKANAIHTSRAAMRLLRWLLSVLPRLTPASATAVMAILLTAILVYLQVHPPTVKAAELLSRSAAAEHAAAKPGLFVHRQTSLEEYNDTTGSLISRSRVDVWASSKAVEAARMYDEAGRLIAADWKNTDGSHTVYNPTKGIQTLVRPEPNVGDMLKEGDVWCLHVSAEEFSSLVTDASSAVVEEKGSSYVVEYKANQTNFGGPVLEASLVLRRSDLHPVEQVLVLSRGEEITRYRFSEKTFERVPRESVPPSVLQPDTGLSGRAGKPDGKYYDVNQGSERPQVPGDGSLLSEAAAAELKAEALYQMHGIGSCLLEQAKLSTVDGKLWIQAVVESEDRKAQMKRALDSLIRNPSVQVDISTYAEAVAGRSHPVTERLATHKVAIVKERFPVYADVRQFLEQKIAQNGAPEQKVGPEAQLDEEVRNYARRVLGASRQALLQVWAINYHALSISQTELNELSPTERERLSVIVKEHLRAFKQKNRELRTELESLFPSLASTNSDGVPDGIAGPAHTMGLVKDLIELASSHEQAVRMAFALSENNGGEAMVVKSERFYRSLRRAEALADIIESQL